MKASDRARHISALRDQVAKIATDLRPKMRASGAVCEHALLARKALSKIAHSGFRDWLPGVERPEAVIYCLGAIERFENLPVSGVQRIAFEIAMLGRHGSDGNDPNQKYQLKSLKGSFSGLHLVCLMYVGFTLFAPEQDVGFDLSKEYAAAQALTPQATASIEALM
jgi:hypothetical protein